MTRAASTECLLPLPATKEWGEGRGEGRPCKHWTKSTLTGSRHPSPWPSPRFAGRGYSRRRVAYPTVSSVNQGTTPVCLGLPIARLRGRIPAMTPARFILILVVIGLVLFGVSLAVRTRLGQGLPHPEDSWASKFNRRFEERQKIDVLRDLQ